MLWQVVEDQNQEEELNMAFKFKVKKRPNMAEAVASAFALGAVQGGTTALQNAMKEREERKKQQKILDQELRTKSNDIGQLANLTNDPEVKRELNTLQIQALKYPSVESLDDAVTATGVFNDTSLQSIGKSEFNAMIPEERFPVKKFKIGETRERKVGSDFVTESYKINPMTGQPSWQEVARAPRVVKEEKKYRAYNKTTGELMQATESEVEGNPNIAFGTPQQPATKKVLNKATGEEQFATEAQIANAKGNLVPTISQPAFLTLFDEIPENISPSLSTSVSLGQAMNNEIKLSPGTIIDDKDLGKLTFTGGDQTNLENYRIDAK